MLSNEHYEFSMGEPSIEFTPDEEERGQRLLRQMGVPEGSWYVCVHARDPKYLSKRKGFGQNSAEPSYYDCSIDTFHEAMRYIVDQGGYILRMGALVSAPLPKIGTRVIDYATNHRTDFLDIYLSARCRFFLGSTSGLYSVPMLFNVQIGITNYCPYIFTGQGRRTLYLPKLLQRRSDGQILTFTELKAMGLFDESLDRRREIIAATTYENLGLDWIDNTPEEIRDLCQDILDKLEGRSPPDNVEPLQKLYKGLYSGPNSSPHSARIGPRFALRHRALIENAQL